LSKINLVTSQAQSTTSAFTSHFLVCDSFTTKVEEKLKVKYSFEALAIEATSFESQIRVILAKLSETLLLLSLRVIQDTLISQTLDQEDVNLKLAIVDCSAQSFGSAAKEVEDSIFNQGAATHQISKLAQLTGKSHTTSVALDTTSEAETTERADLSQA
jgi:hypothetical protein